MLLFFLKRKGYIIQRYMTLHFILFKFLEDGRSISKEIAEEALEFFKEHKPDLGLIYDELVAKVRNITKKND